MTKIDPKKQFEREYTPRFVSRAVKYGIDIKYEDDLAAIDYGVHLIVFKEQDIKPTNIRVWFQFKGKNVKNFPKQKFNKNEDISQSISIEDLRQWYKDSDPVYLVVYIEAVDDFFAVDIKKYIDQKWGDSVFKDETFIKKGETERPETITIKIPKSSRVDEKFWENLFNHQSMRIDGASYRGVPLPHNRDLAASYPSKMSPELFEEIVKEILVQHRFLEKHYFTLDLHQIYPHANVAGDKIQLLTGILRDPYEMIFYMTSEIIPDEDEFRKEGQSHKIQGKTAVIIHSDVKSRPDMETLEEFFNLLIKNDIETLLVFVNDYMSEKPLTGEKAYNCFPEFSMGNPDALKVFCVPQHLEDLGRNILITKIYLKFQERIPWVSEELSKKLRDGEVFILD